jgi:hypothetical protein
MNGSAVFPLGLEEEGQRMGKRPLLDAHTQLLV